MSKNIKINKIIVNIKFMIYQSLCCLAFFLVSYIYLQFQLVAMNLRLSLILKREKSGLSFCSTLLNFKDSKNNFLLHFEKLGSLVAIID